MSWFSLVIGQNASRQLATTSENLVASTQFLVALATSESQFRTLLTSHDLLDIVQASIYYIPLRHNIHTGILLLLVVRML